MLAFAQDFPLRKQSPTEEMNMKNYDKDTSAHAVVLKEFGKCEHKYRQRVTSLSDL